MTNTLFSIMALITCTISQDVTDVLELNGNTTLLWIALGNAGLLSTLRGTGPFTVFAPTDDAFTAASPLPSNISDILEYHVLEGEELSNADLSDGSIVETMNGQSITVQRDGNDIYLYDSNGRRAMVTDDGGAPNGAVYFIDMVLLPDGTIADVTANIESLSSLDGALVANDLDDVLMTDGPFTLFAPTNTAVSAFNGTIDSDVLLYHVLGAEYVAANVPTTATALATENTDMTELTVLRNDEGVFVTDQQDRTGQVTIANIVSTNGVVHVIDIVLSPESLMPKSTMDETSTMEPDGDSVNQLSPYLGIFCFCVVCLFNIF